MCVYARESWFVVSRRKGGAMAAKNEPGGHCDFTGIACQGGCWAWRLDGKTDRCFAFDDLPDGWDPRDWYNACLIEMTEEFQCRAR